MTLLALGQVWVSPLGRTYKVLRILRNGQVVFGGGRGSLFVATEVLCQKDSGWTLMQDVGSGVTP